MPDDFGYDVFLGHSANDKAVVGSGWAQGKSYTFHSPGPPNKRHCSLPSRLGEASRANSHGLVKSHRQGVLL